MNIQIIPGGTVSIGRNAGAKLATTPYLVFIDADTTIIDKDTLQECLNYCCIKNKKLITCNVKPITTDLRCKLLWSCFNKIQKLLPEPFCVGAFFFTEKQTFDELGGFDELVHQSEDFLLSRKYNKNYFYILNKYITQDDRRFKKMGYLPFIFLVLKNYLNKNEIQHFKQDVNYW